MVTGHRWSIGGFLKSFRLPLAILLLVLVVVRTMLPFAVRDYINQQLDQVEDYAGKAGAVRMDLWRGAYQILDLRLYKTNADVPVPFVSIPVMDLSIEWRQLFDGAVVGKVKVTRPELNFVQGPTEEAKQTGMASGWTDTLESLFPFTINRFEVHDGVIRYTDPSREPPVAIYLTNLFAVATNLTNVENEEEIFPSGLVARGQTTGEGELALSLLLNPLAEAPTFRLTAGITGMDLTALNDFLSSYAGVRASAGRFWVFANIAAADGEYRGFVKPLLLDVNLLNWEQIKDQNIFQTLWESLVAGVVEIFENQPTEQVATRVPIQGEFEAGGDVDLWSTIGGILRNAFLQALAPGVPGPVPLPEDEGRNGEEQGNEVQSKEQPDTSNGEAERADKR